MQGDQRYGFRADGGVRLELTSTTTSPLAIDVAESTEMRIQRLVSENPVIIFSRSSCCMCHVMKQLLSTIGVHPTVIELEEDEIGALNNNQVAESAPEGSDGGSGSGGAPALYIGGALVGGFESLVALHLSGHLVPKLVEVGVLENNKDQRGFVNPNEFSQKIYRMPSCPSVFLPFFPNLESAP